MKHRLTKLPLTSRIIAAGCIAVWMAGVSACDLQGMFCCKSPGSEARAGMGQGHSHDAEHAVADTNGAHDTAAHHSGEADSHSHDSPVPGRDGSCCSSLKAVAQTSTSVALGKPALQPISFLCAPVEMRAAEFALVEGPPDRHSIGCARVMSPEVCLGPAFQSNAPPAFS